MPDTFFPTLEHLATAVILLDGKSHIAYLNPAAENLFALSNKNLIGHPMQHAFTHTEQLATAMQQALSNNASYIEHDLTLGTHAHGRLHLRCTATPLQLEKHYLLLECHPMDRSLKMAREEHFPYAFARESLGQGFARAKQIGLYRADGQAEHFGNFIV